MGLVFIGAFLAYAMTLAEYAFVKRTSVITLAVAGMAKEIITILLSIVIFGDRITLINGVGL